MGGTLLEWFRDDDGSWQVPDGRRGEFVSLAVSLPVLAVFLHFETELPRPAEHRLAAVVGVWCGFLYATYYRTAFVERVPDWISVGQVVSLLAGGLGLTILRLVHVADPTVVFVLTAGGTILLLYLVRWFSPFHPGLEPPRRGVEPPPARDVGANSGADASGDH
ncbi:hypothetical protein [Natrinema salaciae]|uniref:Uncharacterized protein n=1 Tax=Natrinema salaciae TaxID=1186196 RepID=A0A1H9GID3_9EURY|nr:hypothetical protein [Natrinema salaciae]SEQ49658.1 hypothetical protein SAMN04489841_1889 [Natrinema salaciae]